MADAVLEWFSDNEQEKPSPVDIPKGLSLLIFALLPVLTIALTILMDFVVRSGPLVLAKRALRTSN